VYKKSAFQLYALERRDRRVRALLRHGAAAVRAMEDAHQSHLAALDLVVRAVREAGAEARAVYRAHFRRPGRVDLVVTVGGDGTLLDASHRVLDTPMVAVNSHPARSVGYLAAATAPDFPALLARILRGGLRPRRLTRLLVTVGGRHLGPPVLNDVLFCHPNPAAMSRYHLTLGARAEEHKSSGLWVATPAGSTAAIFSAGGTRDRLESRRFQFRAREPYAPPGQRVRLTHGFVRPGDALRVESFMRQGVLFVDGSHLRFPVGMAQVLEVSTHPHPLRLYLPHLS
jgi:NAD+ kinase